MKLLFLFFFSSRRRHTRSYGDWSSDVCSSDLVPAERMLDQPPAPVGETLRAVERPTPEQVELDTARELDDRSARDGEEACDLGARAGRNDQPLAGARPPAHSLLPALREPPAGGRTRFDRAQQRKFGA